MILSVSDLIALGTVLVGVTSIIVYLKHAMKTLTLQSASIQTLNSENHKILSTKLDEQSEKIVEILIAVKGHDVRIEHLEDKPNSKNNGKP